MFCDLLLALLDLLFREEVQFFGLVLDHAQHVVLMEVFGLVHGFQLAFLVVTEILRSGLAVAFDSALPVRNGLLGLFEGHLSFDLLFFVAFERFVHQFVLS